MDFGSEIKSQFLVDDSVTFINHGSYGLTVKPVLDRRIRLIYEQENQPDVFFRFNLDKYYDEAVASAAEFLGANKENLVLVDNVTTGVNTVIKSLKYEPGDQILINTHTYNAMKNIASHQCDRVEGVESVHIQLPSHITCEKDIVDLYKKSLDENPRIKVAIIDHISSPSAIVFPIKKLIALCRERGVLSVIDGAHAAGQISLNLEDYAADFYSGNFHKWCYASRSCGYLWISPEYHNVIHSLVTSHGYKHSLSSEFSYCGTRDISSFLCLPTALRFYNDTIGNKKLTEYADELLTFAQDVIAKALGTERLNIPKAMRAPCMALVKVPYEGEITFENADNLTKVLYTKYKVQVVFTPVFGSMWVRFCANVYNTKEDYLRLKDALVQHFMEQ